MDRQTESIIENTVRRETKSLLQYLHESFPWTSLHKGDELDRLEMVIQEEHAGVATLIEFFQKRSYNAPFLGSFPGWFTNLNNVSFDYLVPLLLESQRGAIERLEADIAALSDAEALAHAEAFLETKRRNLKRLESLHSPQPVA